MPLRPAVLRTCCPTPADLPILPFLAPRVFTPWPSRGRRAQSSTSIASKQPPEQVSLDSPSLEHRETRTSIQLYSKADPKTGVRSKYKPILAEPPSNVRAGLSRTADNDSTVVLSETDNYGCRRNGRFPNRFSSDIASINSRSCAGALAPGFNRLSIPAELRRKDNDVWVERKEEKAGPSIRKVRTVSINTAVARRDMTMWEIAMHEKARATQQSNSLWKVHKPRLSKSTSTKDSPRQSTVVVKRRKPHPFTLPHPLKPVSPKYKRFGSLHQSGQDWQRSFTLLYQRYRNYIHSGNGSPGPYISRIRTVIEDSAFPMTLKSSLINQETSDSLRATWLSMSEPMRSKLWPELMLTTLANHPDSALKVLVGTWSAPYPPDYAANDCMNFIILHYLHETNGYDPSESTSDFTPNPDILTVFDAMMGLLRTAPSHHIQLDQHSILLFMRNLDLPNVRKLYVNLMELGHPLKNDTLVHLASFFAKSGDPDLGLEILKRLLDGGVDLSESTPGTVDKWRSLCATLLAKTGWTAADAGHPEVFASMLEGGLEPNCIIYNILIYNYFQSGDYETGKRLYDKMSEHGIEPSNYTYSILLNDAKKREDIPDLRRIVQLIMEKKAYHPIIMTDVIHATYLIHQREQEDLDYGELEESTNAAFEAILPIFCEYFHIRPLSVLIPRFLELYPQTSEYAKRRPIVEEGQTFEKFFCDAPIMNVMITAYLQGIKDPVELRDFLERMQSLVNDPKVPRYINGNILLRTTYSYNTMLKALGKFPETLPLCPGLVEDMLKKASGRTAMPTDIAPPVPIETAQPSTRGTGQPEHISSPPLTPSTPQEPRPSKQRGPLPDIYTWNILLDAFMTHGQARAAEKVLALMITRGIRPSIVTWNMLVAGYVRMEDAEMTVLTLERIKRAGLETDHVTMNILSKWKSRTSLAKAMRRMEAARDQREKLEGSAPSMAENRTLANLGRVMLLEKAVARESRDLDAESPSDSAGEELNAGEVHYEYGLPVVRDIIHM